MKTNQTITSLRALLLSLPLAAVAVGCGGDDTGGTSTTSASATGAGGADCGTTSSATASSSTTASSATTTAAGGAGGSGVGGGGGAGGGAPKSYLDPYLFWYHDNREKLDAHIAEFGKDSAGYDAMKPPVAIFDWDNTVIKNDIGDIVVFWQLNHDLIIQPADWQATSHMLTPAAVSRLTDVCSLVAPDLPIPTSTNPVCADEIATIYTTGKTTTIDPMTMMAYAAFDAAKVATDRMEPTYAWAVQLQKGYTPQEVRGFAKDAMDAALAAPIMSKQPVGSGSQNAYLRVYAQIKDLIATMQTEGFDVWVVSASSQYIVEEFALKVGVASDHVIGVRVESDANGKTTYDFQECGGVEDNTLITYILGKRCWINKVIYGDDTAVALEKSADPAKLPVFGAGDSNTDLTFLQDARGMALVINRGKKDLMCNAYANLGDKWIVNPMFIDPRKQSATPYACTTVDDENGDPIPADQPDTVFCSNGVYCDP